MSSIDASGESGESSDRNNDHPNFCPKTPSRPRQLKDNRQHSTGWKIMLAGMGILALGAVTACSGGDGNKADNSQQSAHSVTLSGTSTNADSADTESSAQPTPADTPSESATEDAKRRNMCHTPDLRITAEDQQGAAGSTLFNIVFKNTGSSECTLKGYPGVSMVTDNNGTQLGASADREDAQDLSVVKLQPNQQVSAPVQVTKVDVMNRAECRPHDADGIRVYPPDETRSAFIPMKGLTGCSGKPRYMTIQPIQQSK